MLKYHILTGLRNLARGRFSTFINIFGLALGMATTLFILLWVQNEWSFDTYHTDADRIYRLHSHIKISDDETWHWGTTPLLLGDVALEELPEVQASAKMTHAWGGKTLQLNGALFKEKNVAYVAEGWFNVFDYQFFMGDTKTFFEHPNSLIMTRSKSEKLFGAEHPIGKIITIDTTDFVVRGVIADNPVNSSFQLDYLMPLAAHLSNPAIYENESDWGNFNYFTFLKLQTGANQEYIGDKTTALLRSNKPEDTTSYITLLPLADMHFDQTLMSDNFSHGNKRTSRIFTIIGLLILLIACINYVSLTTAKASIRAKEISVKKIIGAGKANLFTQFMLESTITSILSLVLAIGLTHLLLPLFNRIVEQAFQLDYGNPAIWLILAGTTVFAILLTGIYPALLLSSFRPVNLLRGQSWLAGNNAHFRKGLVVLQFVISTTLIISVIIISGQLHFIKNTELGYERANIFSVVIPYGTVPPEELEGLRSVFVNELKGENSIDQITTANQMIVNARSTHSGSLDWEGHDPDFQPSVAQLSADDAFQALFELELLEGRWFQAGNIADESNVILNETAVKTFQLKPPYVGQRFSFHGEDGQIIGVVKDFHFRSLREKIMPMVIYNDSWARSWIFVKTTGDRTAAALAAAEKTWAQLLPEEPFEYVFMDESFEKLYRTEQRSGLLFNIFAGIALVISCLGLFGLATFATERRTKEIGIRKILGASATNIVSLISKEFVVLVFIAILIAAPIAWWAMDKWLADFAYRIEIKWWMFALAGVMAIVIAVLTVSFQAVRAAVANPVESLRSE